MERSHALALRWTDSKVQSRRLRVVEIHRESVDVRSFYLEADSNAEAKAELPLEPFAAGQYLPVSLSVPGQGLAVERTYSLSNSPHDSHYRISVKRESRGLVSRYLHDRVQVGDVLEAGAPSGTFVLDPNSTRPAALVSAGVGLTPMVSMLHALGESQHPVIFVHGARDGEHHSLRDEVRNAVNANPNAKLHIRYSQPSADDVEGRDYHSTGHLQADLFEKLIPGLDADYYLCGPPSFMAELQQGLQGQGVPAGRIHSESF